MENYENEEKINPAEVMLTIHKEYPQMLLDSPVDLREKESFKILDPMERVFTRLAQEEKLLVFKNPLIEGIEYVPNFFVYDPKLETGKIVDFNIFRFKLDHSRDSKREIKKQLKQIKKIEGMGIRTILLNRSNILEMFQNGKVEIF